MFHPRVAVGDMLDTDQVADYLDEAPKLRRVILPLAFEWLPIAPETCSGGGQRIFKALKGGIKKPACGRRLRSPATSEKLHITLCFQAFYG
jgi:hypothetical protein